MADLIISRDGRAGQDVSPRLIRVLVDVTADVIPHGGHELPLVDEARLLTVEQDCRRHDRRRASFVIDVQSNLTPSCTARRLGLAAAARPLDEDRAGRL